MGQGRRRDSARDICGESMMRDDGGNSIVTIDEVGDVMRETGHR